MSRELWDVYSFDRSLTGRKMYRGDPVPDGGFHLVVHICVFAPDGRMLIQRRQTTKRGWPGLWDLSAGGCAVAGEDSQTAAERELFEELGIRESFAGVRPKLSIGFETGFDDVFFTGHGADISDLRLQAEEVLDVRWASADEVLRLLDEGRFVPYNASFLSLLYDIHTHGGGLDLHRNAKMK